MREMNVKKSVLVVTSFLIVASLIAGALAIREGSSMSRTVQLNDESSSVLGEWIDLSLGLSKEIKGFSPPVTARAVGYSSLSLYESVRYGDSELKSMNGQLKEFDESYLKDINPRGDYSWAIVANANQAEIFRGLYGVASEDAKSKINKLEEDLAGRYSKDIDPKTVERSESLGKSVAKGIIDYANSDGQGEAFNANFADDYTPPTGDGKWVPTPDGFKPALHPYWGQTRPFLTDNIIGTLPPAPPEYSLDKESAFYKEVVEVYDTVKELTPEQKIIAEFWSDDPGLTATPPGHSISIFRQIMADKNLSLSDAAVAYAKLGIGLHDSFIACWYAKYEYDYIRPITVIREHIDPDFEIPLGTPPFPEYPSGHSVQSGTTAQILTDIFGDNYKFTDKTHEKRGDIDGKERSFNSFFDFADEGAISRQYGGIHFRSAIDLGVVQGKEIGQNIRRLEFK